MLFTVVEKGIPQNPLKNVHTVVVAQWEGAKGWMDVGGVQFGERWRSSRGGGVGGAGEGNGSVRHRTNGGGHGGGEGKAGGGGGADSGETDGDLSNAPKLRLATKTSSTVKLSTSINPCSLKGYEISLVVFQVIFFGVPGVAFASLIIIAVDVAGSLTRNVAIGGGGICVFIYFIRMVCNENKVRPYTELDRRCV